MKKVIWMVAVVLLATITFAEDPSKEAVVEEFFRVAKVREKYETGMTVGFDAGMGMQDLSHMSEEQKAKIEDMQRKVKALLLEEMGWDKVKGEFIKLYLSIYSVAELQEATEVLETPIGRKMVDNEIVLMPKAMQISQEKTKEIMPKIMQISIEAMSP